MNGSGDIFFAPAGLTWPLSAIQNHFRPHFSSTMGVYARPGVAVNSTECNSFSTTLQAAPMYEGQWKHLVADPRDDGEVLHRE